MTEKTRLFIAKIFLVIVVVFFGLFGVSNKAHAQLEERSWGQAIHQFIFEAFVGAIDVRSTALSTLQTLIVEGASQLISNRSFDGMVNCVMRPYCGDLPFPDGAIDPTDDCTDMYTSSVTGTYAKATQNKAQGALVGLTLSLGDIAINEAPPVNLAYYAKREVSDIPIIENTAYAQSALGDDFLLSTVYNIWTRMRNIAYGLLAVFMLIIGIMIMMRHKVNPQTVVTIQQAIPKIVISVILITFSYPIIALAIALVLPLSGLAVAVVGEAGSANLIAPFLALSAIPLIVTPGHGVAIMVLILVLILVGIFFLVKMVVTLIAAYIKLVVAMLTGPFIFAWGAIPGNEKAITDWFKRVAVSVIVIPLMIGGLRMIQFITNTLAANTVCAQADEFLGQGFVGTFATSAGTAMNFVLPILTIILLIQFGQIPKKLEEAVFGFKRK